MSLIFVLVSPQAIGGISPNQGQCRCITITREPDAKDSGKTRTSWTSNYLTKTGPCAKNNSKKVIKPVVPKAGHKKVVVASGPKTVSVECTNYDQTKMQSLLKRPGPPTPSPQTVPQESNAPSWLDRIKFW